MNTVIEMIDGCPTGNVHLGLTFREFAELERELKAWEIIKEKAQFKFLEERENRKIIQLYFAIGNSMFPVTQEEYELLKELLL